MAVRARSAPVWQHCVALLLTLPLLAAGGAASAYYYRMHRWSTTLKLSDLPAAAPLSGSRRILVLSPHCDDETLGVGALISDARRKGIPVTVAFLTNGDGFPVAASRSLREVDVSPADFVRFAEIRQHEALAAEKELGVANKDVVFLGYPDRGLKSLWETNWSPDNLFRSYYTGHTHSPYSRTYSPRTAYCGQSLLGDLVRLMEQVRPTDIYVTHPADDHPDHYTAAAFAQAALRECREKKTSVWAGQSRLHFYIVHRGDWPLPQGLHTDRPLLPPVGLAGLDTSWNAFRASPDAVTAKQHALEQYVSQTEITGRFLRSFVRINEIFGEIPDCAVRSSPALPGGGGSPAHQTTFARDAVGDDLMRYAAPAADLTGIQVRQTAGGLLRVTVTTRGPVSPRVRYRLLLRAMGGADTILADLQRSQMVTRDLQPATDFPTNLLQATVPLSSLGINGMGSDSGNSGDSPPKERCVWVAAETRLSERLPIVDRVGYRAFAIRTPTQAGPPPAE